MESGRGSASGWRAYRHDGVHVEGDVHVEVHVAAAAVVVVDEEAMLWTIKVIAADGKSLDLYI